MKSHNEARTEFGYEPLENETKDETNSESALAIIGFLFSAALITLVLIILYNSVK